MTDIRAPRTPQGELTPEKQALLALRRMRARVEELERAAAEPIAIVGLACRFPGEADTPDRFWRLLHEGVDAITEVPPDRWDVDALYDPDRDAPGKMYTRSGGFLACVDRFDADHFRIAPREAASMDPQQRLLLEVAWEALENAGCAPDALDGTESGVFVGISTNDYAQVLLRASEGSGLDAYFGTGNALNAAAGRLSYVLGLQGPSISVDTACSSSLVAVHLACQSLRSRECLLALAAGVNVILTPDVTINFCRARMLAPDGRCKTFDAAADGYVRGEGCGVVVLKRLSDAVAAGDRVLALIRGSAVNQDGRSGGFTAPNERAQAALIRKALGAARLTPGDVSYIEAHGTGTSLGDPIEMHALAAVFGEGRAPDHPLIVGSVKTNIGHLEAAAGVAGLIKVVLALQHRTIPPHLHFKSLNPHIGVGGFPMTVPTAGTAWQSESPRVAGVSSFGFSGTNAHIVLQEAPPEGERPGIVDRPRHILALSARTDSALRAIAGRYAAALSAQAMDLADVCFTVNAGRAHHEQRGAIAAASVTEMEAALRELSSTGASPRARRGTARHGDAPDVVFLFTGQGSQYAGMGRQLYASQPVFRRAIDRCDAILRTELDRPLLSVLYPAPEESSPIDETAYTQPALFAFEYALAELWRDWGIEPAAVLGHSIGEYVGACVAGVFALDDALKLVAARGRLMQALPGGGAMAAVFAGEARVRPIVAAGGARIAIAAVNGPDNTVVSGGETEVSAVIDELSRQGIRSTRLSVSHAFHSSLLDPMLDDFERAAAAVSYASPRIPFVSNLTGALVDPSFAFGADYWRRHAREAVRFGDGISALVAQGYRTFLEIGPSAALLAMARQCITRDDIQLVPSLRRTMSEWEPILDALAALYVAGAPVNWRAFDRDFHRRTVSLPTYPFERERFWAPTPAAGGSTVSAASPRPGRADDAGAGDCYQIAWRRVARPDSPRDLSGETWVLSQGGDVAAQLAAHLRERGARTLTIGQPTHAASIAEQWRDVLGSCGRHVDHVVHLAALDAGSPDPNTVAAQPHILGSLLELTHATAGTPDVRPRLSVVTSGAQPVRDSDPVSCAQAPAWGLTGTIGNEHPELRPVCVDLEPGVPVPIDLLCDELRARDGENRVALREGTRFVARLVPLPVPAGGRLAPAAEGSCIITGGLGALGLLVARWLVGRGVRRLALIGRREPGEAARKVIADCEAEGARVRVIRGDVTRAEDVSRVLAEADRELGPVRGVVHAAGVLDDGLLVQQDWDRFAGVLGPKLAGAWHLHEQTRQRPLDFFVLFSSAASLFGSPGQGSYSAANAFLDALAHERRRLGLNALSVNWGPWRGAGMAGDVDAAHQRRWTQAGVGMLEPSYALRTLEQLLSAGIAQAAVLKADWSRFASREERSQVGLLADLLPHAAPAPPAEGLKERLAAIPAARRPEALEAYVRGEVIAVLGREADFSLDRERAFRDLGMDSLMALELRNRLQASAGVALSPTVAYEWPTVAMLTQLLAGELLPAASESAPAERNADQTVDLTSLLSRVEGLSDGDIDRLLATS